MEKGSMRGQVIDRERRESQKKTEVERERG